MPIEDPAQGPGPASPSVPQATSGHWLYNITLSDETKNMISGLYDSALALYGYITSLALRIGTRREREERVNNNSTTPLMAMLIIGALILIVVPGLVLGFATGQVQWGIALSGAISTVVGVFAGLCYHLTTRN
ncbi:hypothetical protein J7T55_005564 [Diaporthe amygdali]|uniref:uncharacterized protein n=1 Tax=Phomopsis amygdali TaxID=1214568 RepID=UPI0022FF1763|nr:uncharacterized protein J7T55_005564 [Diaporthe amygdali]KAJ0124226.1 hypothetical protein J7T55_005564 [Diaporthe amygdali]